MTLKDRIRSKTPKRILALDGGGIRGLITLGFLNRIELILKDRYNDPAYRLCDYFDLIGGTSTGAIIAAGLAKGMSVAEIREKYFELGDDIFSDKRGIFSVLGPKFTTKKLEYHLDKIFDDYRLGDERLKTGLVIIAKRIDTGSTWALTNNPFDPFYQDNKDILLKHAIRASTAAPTYFKPEELAVNANKTEIGGFVDGGVSMFNNPSLQLFFSAVVEGYGLHWPTGQEQLMICSVGTGSNKISRPLEQVMGTSNLDFAKMIPNFLMYDASRLGQSILQLFSQSPTKWHFDSIEKDFKEHERSGIPTLLHYMRYDAPLNENTLSEIGLEHLKDHLSALREMDQPQNKEKLYHIGDTCAAQKVETGHFPPVFDRPNIVA